MIFLKENIDNILKDFNIADVWGVGRQLSKLYIKNGIDNAYKLKNISNTWVKKSTNVLGAKTVMELRGIPCIDLETEETRRKSCCVSRSFGKKVESLDKLKESITTHCLNAAEKIRTDKQTTRDVTIFIRTSPFDKNRKYYSNSITIELPVRFFGYDLSLYDTPYKNYIFILGKKSNEAVSILDECSLLIFQSLLIPA